MNTDKIVKMSANNPAGQVPVVTFFDADQSRVLDCLVMKQEAIYGTDERFGMEIKRGTMANALMRGMMNFLQENPDQWNEIIKEMAECDQS